MVALVGKQSTRCQVCSAIETQLLRCSNCQQVVYCSVACQQVDWQRGHKRFCRAWSKLRRLTSTASLQTAEQDFEAANQAIESLHQAQKDEGTGSTPRYIPPNKIGSPMKKAPAVVSPERLISAADWDLVVEDMPNLRCFQIFLTPSTPWSRPCRTATLQIELASLAINKTQLRLSYRSGPDPITLVLFKAVDRSAIRTYPIGQATVFSVRIGYKEFDCDHNMDYQTTLRPSHTSFMTCKQCGSPVVHPDSVSPIQKVRPLPSPGRWDDMEDYLICYEGMPTFSFDKITTATAASGNKRNNKGAAAGDDTAVLLEDTTMFAIHSSRTTNVCALHVPEYGRDPTTTDPAFSTMDGDALVRGTRPWHPGSIVMTEEGMCLPLACAQCSQVLGFGGAHWHRLYKHQVKVGTPLQTCSAFVIHELVRYAETKAIFSCIVLSDRGGSSVSLRLVSWDTFSLVSSSTTIQKEDSFMPVEDEDTDRAVNLAPPGRAWCRTAKVLYSVQRAAVTAGLFSTAHVDANANAASEDVWLWAQPDWCCPPNKTAGAGAPQNYPTRSEGEDTNSTPSSSKNTATGPASVVELHLPHGEWEQLVSELDEARALIPKDVASATVAAKLGREPRRTEKIRLAAILLS